MRIACILLVAGWLLPAATARAQQGPVEEQPSLEGEAEAETPERPEGEPPAPGTDMAAIEEALAADAEATEEATGGPTGPAPTPAEPGPVAAAIQSLNPNLSVILDVALAYFSDDDDLQTGAHDPTRTGFNLQQVELALSASVDPYFRVDGNIVFFLTGVEVEELYGTTLDLPAQLQFRFGQFYQRFGRINRTHVHTWDFVDQPFALGRYFGAEGLRGLSAELSWLAPLPWYVELVGAVQNADGGATTRSFYGASDQGIHGLDDFLYVTAIKQFFPLSQDWSLFWGLSGAFGPNGTGRDNHTDIYGTDLYLKYRPITRQSFTIVSLQAELFYRRRQVPDALLQDVSGYGYVFWRFAQRWGTAARYEWGTPPRNLDGEVVADDLNPEWTGTRHRVSANLTFWPSEFSRFRVQGSVDLPEWREDPIYALFLAGELVIGAHGAHRF